MLRSPLSIIGQITIAAASMAAIGCRQGAAPPPRGEVAGTSVVAALNASPKTGDFVLEATNSIKLPTGGLVVDGGDLGARGTSGPFLSGNFAIDALAGVTVQTTHNLIADSVRLGSGVHAGDVQTNHFTDGTGAVHGTVTAVVPLPALPAASPVTPGTANLTVNTGATVTAGGFAYATISIGTGSTLRLPAGTYQLKDLNMSAGARIEALGPVQIRIANRLCATSGAFIGPKAGVALTAKDIRVEISGKNGTGGGITETPRAAAFTSGAQIAALMLVPSGTLQLGTGTNATGAFMARDIDAGGAGAHVVFQDGFGGGATCTPPSCDDGNPCTTDACGVSGCTHTPVAPGTSCGDGNACNGAETCSASGACQPGTPVTCKAADACHVAGTCNPTTGACSNPPAPAGTSCADADACNGAETCDGAGACKPGTPVVCVAADACHVAGACDHATGTCSNPPAAAGTSCGDGNACNGAETCDGAGACVGGAPVTCVATDACHVAGTCNPSTGACSNPAAPDGTGCDDGNACTRTDSCQAGQCSGSNPVTCTAADQCHAAGTCNPTNGLCSNPTKPDGSGCDDGNACTLADACQAGTCAGVAVTCAASDQCHAAGTCNPTTGACSSPTVADGTACNDGNDCTSGDSCAAGVCKGSGACTSIAVTETAGGANAQPQLDTTLTADVTQAVPGDIVSFTSVVKNSGTLVGLGFSTFNVQNNGSAPFVVKGYQQTMEYFSVSQGTWIPFAKLAFDADGNPVPITDPTLVPMQWGFVQPFFGSDVSYGPTGVVGTSIAPGGNGNWIFTLGPIIPGDIVNILFNPAEASDLRVAIRFDVPNGPPPAPGVASIASALAGVTGEVDDLAVQLHFPAPNTLDPTGTPMTPLGAGPLAPGASRTFTSQVPAPAMLPRDPTDTDAGYLFKLNAYRFSAGYATYASPTGHSVTFDPFPPNAGFLLGIDIPIITPQKSGPATSNAGLTQTYSVALANSGNAVAGPFSIVDSVDGAPIAGTAVTAANVAPGATGNATVAAPSPLDRPAGPMTDTVAVTWQDRNGTSYGPMSSSFTLAIGPGHPEGYLTIAGGTTTPDLLGSSKTLTATALDQFGNGVAGLAVHVAVTGANAQTFDLTTGADGRATFTYAATSIGNDSIVASATPTTTPIQSDPVHVQWATSVGTPCTGGATPLDVMMIIDGSPSMFDGSNVAAAQTATNAFIDSMDFSIDQVGAVMFSGNANLVAQLTTNATLAKSEIDTSLFDFAHACDGFCGGGSNFLAAFQFALAELQGPRHRPGVSPLVVFISDGGNTGVDPTPAIAALKAAGVRVIAIGMGSTVDVGTMRSIASSQNDYFYAPTASELGWVYGSVAADACRILPPVVSAGGDQGLYSVRLPDVLTLQGEAHGAGPQGDKRLVTTWSEISGPSPVTFADPSAPVTKVLFTEPGTYVLQLEATDGFLVVADRATITVDPEPNLAGASLVVTLATPSPATTGTTEVITAALIDASLAPIGNFPLQLTVAGVNPVAATGITNAAGAATFSYTGTRAGNDQIHARALGPGFTLDSATVPLQWTDPPTGGPVMTQGWIASPLNQSTITERVPIVLSDTVTLTSGTLRYWPDTRPADVHTLATGLTGGPGTTLATLDTTLLANGSYVISLDGVDDTNNERQSFVLVTVTGEYKPGRLVVEVTDLTIPIAGLPITVGRRYDSLEKDRVSDFGNGWSLIVGSPKLEVDRGHNVTLTMPNGRRSTFAFTPSPPVIAGGPLAIILGYMLFPAYTPTPGVFGTLTQNDCAVIFLNPFADAPELRCLDSLFGGGTLDYAPTQYTYTDPYGRAFVMGATGELRSIKDLQGNTLTFQPNGIISSAGRTITFARDTQGRITSVVTPFISDFDETVEWDYSYDTAGNLDSVTAPGSGAASVTHYTYDTEHRLLTTKDPRGNFARTSTYGADGRLATDTDAAENLTSYVYDTATRTTRITNPDGGVLARVFDDQGLLLTETDPRGHTTKHEYDANQEETKQTNAVGEVTTATYDGNGNQKSITTAKGTTTIAYNDSSQPTTVTDRRGHITTLDYDDRHVLQRFADELGTRFAFANSEQGLPLAVDDAEGHRAFLTYDAAGNLTSRTDWLGRVTRVTYDEVGRKLSEATARGVATGLSATTNYTYFLSGLLRSAVDVNGYLLGYGYDQNGNKISEGDSPTTRGQTNYTYNALNQLVQATHSPDGPTGSTTVSYTRDFRGNPLTMTDENGRTTNYEYDVAGNLTKTIFADGTFTTRTYDDLNRLASLTDERGNTTTYEYDPGCGCSDRVTKVTDALGHATTTTYDANGRRSSTADANGHTTSYVYDIRGQLIETDFPDGTSTQRSYDSRGRPVSATDQTGATTSYSYDDQGQLTSVTDPLGNVIRYAYDLDSNLASLTDANNHTATYEYDLLKRKTKRTLPLGQVETFAYDVAGRQTGDTDFRGKTTTMTYDTRDRMLTTVPDASLGEAPHSYVYSPTGMRTSATDGTGTTSYTYDLRDRRLIKAAAAGTLTYTYDPAGNLGSVRSSNTDGTSVNYAWDAANELVSMTDNRIGGVSKATYTPTKRPSALTQANGVGVTYSYDSMDRVAGMFWQQGSSPAFGSWQYEYNERGQRRTTTDITNRRAEFGYDAAARLVSETISGAAGPSDNGTISYALDAFANRLSRISGVSAVPSASYSYDANDQLTADGHDASGNTTNSAGHTYAYDFENRLVSKDGGAVTFRYNCDGDRVAKTAGGITTQYLVDDLNPTGYLQVLEEVVGGSVKTRYTYGTTLISQTRDVSTTPVTSYYGHDAHGNITFLTDAGGSVTDSYDYDAWGILVARTGSTPNSRLYAGEEFDPDLGLVNLRARQYNSSTGRFFTLDPLDVAASTGPRDGRLASAVESVTDPHFRAALEVAVPDRSLLDRRVLDAANWNHFLYGNADPVNRIDPTGRTEVLEAIALAIAIMHTGVLIAQAVTAMLQPPKSEEARLHHKGAAICSLAFEGVELIATLVPIVSLVIALGSTLCTVASFFP